MTVSTDMSDASGHIAGEFELELFAIADWWADHAFDLRNAKIHGEVDATNAARADADIGAIYCARLLWFFSNMCARFESPQYRKAADIAYRYLAGLFCDQQHGGVYWKIRPNGEAVDSKKHVYAQSFSIYAFSAYYSLTGMPDALEKAIDLYRTLARVACQPGFGYYEAFDRTWRPLDDVRLSDDEPLWPRNVNTQLHLMEAFTALYRVWRDDSLRSALTEILEHFRLHYIDPQHFHLRMYLDEQWQNRASSHSYGHDIECSWLLWEALELLDDHNMSSTFRPLVINMAQACLEQGIGDHGEFIDGFDTVAGKPVILRYWWVQAEAIVGFLNAWQMTGDHRYYAAFESVWRFINLYQKDRKHGEWRWLSTLDVDSPPHYKAGFWKAPYHNGRAMLEICRRLRDDRK